MKNRDRVEIKLTQLSISNAKYSIVITDYYCYNELRPEFVNALERYKDWEIDTLIGKDNKEAIVAITERKMGFLLMEKLKFGKQAIPLSKVVVRMLLLIKIRCTQLLLIMVPSLPNINI